MSDAIMNRAKTIWNTMDENEKMGVRFGMFPAARIQTAEAEGFNGTELCKALLNCARQNGGTF